MVCNHSFSSCISISIINWRKEVKYAAAAAKSLPSCPTLCDAIDASPPGSPVPGVLQARTLEWVAISFSNAWKWKVKVKSLSHVQLLVTPWTVAYQAPPFMGFSRQEYWSGVPLPSPDTGVPMADFFDAWQETTKFCKAIILQLKKKILMKMFFHLFFPSTPLHTFFP